LFRTNEGEDVKKLSVQFHMTPEEIVKLLDELEGQGNLYVSDLGIIGEFFPQVYSGSKVLENMRKGFVFIAISEKKPNYECSDQKQFNDLNSGTLYFTLGSKMDLILNESVLSGFIDDDAKILNRFFNGFKKNLNRGCTVCNSNMGTQAFVSNHLYSEGARKFLDSGGSLKALGGNNYYVIEKKIV